MIFRSTAQSVFPIDMQKIGVKPHVTNSLLVINTSKFIHFVLSYDMYIASSKATFTQSANWCFVFKLPLCTPFRKVIQ